MASLLSLLLTALAQQQVAESAPSTPTGLEWMVIASILVPAVLIIVLVYIGERRTV